MPRRGLDPYCRVVTFAEIVLEYFRVLIWPIVVLFLGLLFKRQISALLGRVEEVSAFGASATLTKQALQAEETSLALPDLASVDDEAGSSRAEDEKLSASSGTEAAERRNESGETADAVGVLRAWSDLEDATRQAADLLNLDPPRRPTVRTVVEEMRVRGWVGEATAQLASELTEARNALVHSAAAIPKTTAYSLIQSIERLTAVVRAVITDHGGGEAEQELAAPRAAWTEPLAQVLVDRLRRRGLKPQLATLAFAAHHGGRAPREIVYRLAGYPPNRSLKGFTRPVNSAMEEMVRERVAPEGLSNPMAPLYDVTSASFQRAQGFRMTPDAVDAFAAVLQDPM